MTSETFAPTRRPQLGSSESHEPRINISQFGDGYTQRSTDGINTDPAAFSYVWNAVEESEADYITDFFAARGGVEAFFWTPRSGSPATTYKYICKQWTRTPLGAGLFNISASFTQVFDLD